MFLRISLSIFLVGLTLHTSFIEKSFACSRSKPVRIDPVQKAPAPISHNIIIFDWDDTLLPTGFTGSGGEIVLNTSLELKNDLEAQVASVLKTALSLGRVFIITNSQTGWVRRSAGAVYPSILPLLDQVKVISARSLYEKDFPMSWWKFPAFRSILAEYENENDHLNILALGDSPDDRKVAKVFAKDRRSKFVKSIKVAETPTPDQLFRQLQLVEKAFNYLIQHQGDLDLQLTVTVNSSLLDTQEPEAPSHTDTDAAEAK